MPDRVIEELDEDTCLQLISAGGIGRIAYNGRFGPAVLPVNYTLHDGAIVFRTAEHGPLDEDLRTGIEGAEYKVAFEIDDIDLAKGQGWSVLVQGPAHHVTAAERDAALTAGVESWAPGAVRPDHPVPDHGPPHSSGVRRTPDGGSRKDEGPCAG